LILNQEINQEFMKHTISPSGRDLLQNNSIIETDSMRITKFSFGVTKMDKIDY